MTGQTGWHTVRGGRELAKVRGRDVSMLEIKGLTPEDDLSDLHSLAGLTAPA